MPIRKLRCDYCKSLVDEESRQIVGDIVISKFACGHTITRKASASNKIEVISSDGYELRSYQETAYDFAVKSEFRCLLRMEQRLGKTPTSIALMKRHRSELLPAVIVCKAALTEQYFREVLRWSNGEIIPQILTSGRDIPFNSFQVYICSFNLLSKMLPKFQKQGIEIKAIFADEVQHLVNREAQRTKAVSVLTSLYPDAKRIATSGTPFKNHAAEYFTLLNWLYPERFNNYEKYVLGYVDTIWDGKKNRLGGIAPSAMATFKARTNDFILDMTRADVAPELPTVNRQLETCQFDEEVRDAYNQNLEAFCREYEYTQKFSPGSNLLALLTKLRHLVGVSKVKPITEFASQFLYDTDRKLNIFVHHKDVGILLHRALANVLKSLDMPPPLQLTSELNAAERMQTLDIFEKERRVCITSTKAYNEGFDFSFCNAFIMAEREWSPVDEEQAECRHIGLKSPDPSVSVDGIYFVAMNSMDEFVSQLSAIKWQSVNSTLSGDTSQASKWTEQSMMKAIAEKLIDQGRKTIYRPI
jgi:SNF2 family DNA or RNA helicase